MDSTTDQDLKLQKSSPELITELRRRLPQFVWKARTGESRVHGQIRRRVRTSNTDRLIKLLEPFQEWPQLLDPHLNDLLHPLVSAFAEYLSKFAAEYSDSQQDSHLSRKFIPLPRAICKILYVFCKIRGQKVIIRFLNNEPRYLEPMLDALESWGQPVTSLDDPSSPRQESISWEERFIMLWWLSHLMLAPFDLSSMSSASAGSTISTSPLLNDLPSNTPPIAKRLVQMATNYIGLASKEREAAAILLARIALKPDLQRIGSQKVLFDSSIALLIQGQNPTVNFFTVVGIISFLTKFIISVERSDLETYSTSISESIEYLTSEQSPFFREISSSTLARKLIIKIRRSVTVARIEAGNDFSDSDNDTIGFLITALQDQDTLVRVAASKSLSTIVSHLGSMAESACSDIIDELTTDADIRWYDSQSGQSLTRKDIGEGGPLYNRNPPASYEPDYRHMNAVRWHGFVLTLSQFLLQGFVSSIVSIILDQLTLGIHFEQRSSLGVSVGTNVRDAACLGFWALARRYSTSEINCSDHYPENGSTIQSVANDLVIAATLDPEGNIRRGASAALQEMIGRHPDQIKHGIKLVQVIDYHAIALRSKAMLEVAIEASQLDEMYWKVILHGLLSWRGVGSPDAQSRRLAADAIGCMTRISRHQIYNHLPMDKVCAHLRRTPFQMVNLRHGLILALAQVVLGMLENVSEAFKLIDQGVSSHELPLYLRRNHDMAVLWQVFYFDDASPSKLNPEGISSRMVTLRSSLRSDAIHEAICRLISALTFSSIRGPANLDFSTIPEPSEADLNVCIEIINLSIRKTDPIVINAASEAAANVFRVLDVQMRDEIARKWIGHLDIGTSRPRNDRFGVIAALGAIFQHVGNQKVKEPQLKLERARISGQAAIPDYQSQQPDLRLEKLIIDVLLKQLDPKWSIKQRCATLNSLTSGILNCGVITGEILNNIYISLCDYTINERGDVGSLVRMEATGAVYMLLEKRLLKDDDKKKFVARNCGLAAEKLDKVRWRAWTCLQQYLSTSEIKAHMLESSSISDMAQTSSVEYFTMLLEIGSQDWMRKPFVEGFITSIGAGSESLVQATRAALTAFVKKNRCESRDMLTENFNATLMTIFLENTKNDRLLLPTLDLLVFLLSTNILQHHHLPPSLWQTIFVSLQKSHHQSPSIPKILSCVKIYGSLTRFGPPIGKMAMRKLERMLGHAYPRVREKVEEEIWVVGGGNEGGA